MNQWLAELFLSLPRGLTDVRTLGAVFLVLCWLGYVFFIHARVTLLVRRDCNEAFWDAKLRAPWRRLFYGAARQKAGLDAGGIYIANLAAFWSLLVTTAVHILLLSLAPRETPGVWTADAVMLTVIIGGIGVLCLLSQPSLTLYRRQRWGFGRKNAVLHAALWEVAIVLLLLLWLYGAWFFPAFA